LRWIYEAIDEHWNTFTDDIEIRIMKEYSMLSRKFVKYYSSEYITHTHTHTHTHTRTHTRARARAHTHTHTHIHKIM